MLTRKCPRCGRPAKASMHIHDRDLHTGHRIYEAIKHSSWSRSNPVMATVGMGGLVAATIWKAVEAFHFQCGDCGYSFKF